MLLTVTMNPSVDISYRLKTFNIDNVNRTNQVSKTAGGKGLNVARVAKQTGLEVAATGILGGYLGGYINSRLESDGIEQHFYEIDQESRNCIAIIHEGNQTEILESGPTISQKEKNSFINHFEELLNSKKYSLITMSGSLPTGMESEVYKEMIHRANSANIPVILDASRDNLSDILDDKTLHLKAIKPNIDELNAIENDSITEDVNEIITVLEKERYSRSEWVIVSLGGDGALVKHLKDYYLVTVPDIDVVSPVGSGDSTIAGLAYSIFNNQIFEDSMKSAMTTGVLNTMNEKTGHINMDRFDEIFDQITIDKI